MRFPRWIKGLYEIEGGFLKEKVIKEFQHGRAERIYEGKLNLKGHK